MDKKTFLRELRHGMWLHLPKKKIDEVILSYERYFAEHPYENEAELVKRCGDVRLIVGEQLGGFVTSRLPLRIVSLLLVVLAAHYQIFEREAYRVITVPQFWIAVDTLLIIFFGAVLCLVMGRATIRLDVIAWDRVSKRGYFIKLTTTFILTFVIGVLVTAFSMSIMHDVRVFETVDSMLHISPSEIGYVFVNWLTALHILYISAAAFFALMSVRTGFYAIPFVYICIVGSSFFSSLIGLIGGLNSPDEIDRAIEQYKGDLTFELIVQYSVATVFCVAVHLLLSKKGGASVSST